MHFFLLFYILFFQTLVAEELKIKSIITLNDKVPSECGLSFETLKTTTKILIKKTKKGTTTFFSIDSKGEKLKNANIKTFSQDLNKLLSLKTLDSQNISIEKKTDEDQTTAFFQELLIGGGTLEINDKKIEIKGPVDSKVRLEYLFCTGEMFLPNYETNK